MKKLLLAAAIVLGGLSAQAATTIANPVYSSVNVQDEYTEIALDAVPAAVKSTVEKSFKGTTLEKAYKNEKNEYKIQVSSGEKKYTFFTDAAGNIIKK